MKQTHKEANLFELEFKEGSGAFGDAASLFFSRWTSERQQVLLKGKRSVLQCIGAPSRPFAALSQRESHLSLGSNRGSRVDA